MDPVTLAVGAVIFITGYVSGRIGRARRVQKPRDPYVCGCTHHLAHHDPKTNACKGSVYRAATGNYKPCACQQYVGERPLDLDVLAEQARAALEREGEGSG